MNIFSNRKKTLKISEPDPTYHVTYVGNMVTTFVKGDGCVDRPIQLLWTNYREHCETEEGLETQLVICGVGLKVITAELGVTEYRAHRILYCIAHSQHPRLFVWVYRHDSKTSMKMDIRCHAVLCSSESKAKTIASQLHEKLAIALTEFTREKTRRQNSRLLLSHNNSGSVTPKSSPLGVPLRIKYLSVGKNYIVPSERSHSAPKLGAITEDREEEVNSVEKRWSDSVFRHGCSHSRGGASVETGNERMGLKRVGNGSAVGAIVVNINSRGDRSVSEQRRLSLDANHQSLADGINNNNIHRREHCRRVSDSVLFENSPDDEKSQSFREEDEEEDEDCLKELKMSEAILIPRICISESRSTDSESVESGFSEPDE